MTILKQERTKYHTHITKVLATQKQVKPKLRSWKEIINVKN